MSVSVSIDTERSQESTGLVSDQPVTDRRVSSAQADDPSNGEGDGSAGWRELAACVVGLQLSYLCWGMLQERVMTMTYADGEKFPSPTFCVFSNRVCAIMLGAALMYRDQGHFKFAAPLYLFAPSAISNSLSSYGQYAALHYVSFPLQTLSKSTKVIPVMLMGKVLNGRSYPWVEFAEAAIISAGVSIFALGSNSRHDTPSDTAVMGVTLLALYIVSDSFTSQYQSRVFKGRADVTQFQMMFATNTWSILFTLAALLISGELWITLHFLGRNPAAVWDNIGIALTSATGQLCIFYTIKKFGPVVFTVIMTTRQMLSMVVSSVVFVHPLGITSLAGAVLVFGAIFIRARRNLSRGATPPTESARGNSCN